MFNRKPLSEVLALQVSKAGCPNLGSASASLRHQNPIQRAERFLSAIKNRQLPAGKLPWWQLLRNKEHGSTIMFHLLSLWQSYLSVRGEGQTQILNRKLKLRRQLCVHIHSQVHLTSCSPRGCLDRSIKRCGLCKFG